MLYRNYETMQTAEAVNKQLTAKMGIIYVECVITYDQSHYRENDFFEIIQQMLSKHVRMYYRSGTDVRCCIGKPRCFIFTYQMAALSCVNDVRAAIEMTVWPPF